MHPPILLALGFANLPFVYYGLAAATLPILIHLLNRKKFREVPWAAMRFLVAAVQKNSRRIRVEHWILLAVRTLVILLIASAMARPFLESLGAMPRLAGSRTHKVIVLDGSLSMAYNTPDGTRFERARSLAARLVKDAHRGDPVSLVVLADPPRVIIGDPSPNHDEVLKELAEVVMPQGGTDLVAGFRKVDEVLAASPIPQKEVIILTDLQAASWRRPDGGDSGLKREIARLEARNPRSVVIDLGGESDENCAVTDIHLGVPVVTVGTPTLIRAVVRNFGPARKPGLRASLVVDGGVASEQSVDVAVGEDQPLVFKHTFGSPGDHLVDVRIAPDPLRLDDRRGLAIPVLENLKVLLVDGHFKTEPFQAETDYLAQALSPPSSTEGAPSVIRVEVVPEGQLARQELAGYNAVVLANIAQFTEPEVAALDDYLKQGGGVVLFGGDQVVPDNYNRLLHADGKGLLPAAVGPSVGDASKKESAFGFNPLGFRHPIVEPFADAPESVISGLTGTKTWQFHKLKLPADSPAKVALAFDNGDPAIIVAPRHRGTVIQVATSADSGWTTWPLHPSYPPVMERMIYQASAGKLSERNVRVGQPIDQAFPASALAAPASVTIPGGKVVAAKLTPSSGVSLLHFEDTDLSGVYQVRLGPPSPAEAAFAANPDPAESDPARLDRAGLAAAVPGWKFDYMTNWKELTGNAAAVGRRGELHRPLLYALLACLLLESFLAWRFGNHASRA